ncbi:unnamed protein product [Ambrosiozyma monospora]|uniref:Unnamed protein product n=1 Tax=Ambrosiozyma monospora TaxID=43982 RepID=A0A9W6Z8L3_AMBMO|nr:unnamed protein product [Ambrosiozyma monospora]
MSQPVFMGLGKQAFRFYMLFQHHSRVDEDPSLERSWVPGAVGSYIKQHSRSVYARLGKEIALAGLDCRTERKKNQIISPASYNAIFQRLDSEIKASNGDIKHLYVMLGVPICYPRMVWAEVIMESKMIAPVKYMAQKGIAFKGLVNDFDGSVELLDDLNDHWCAMHHKRERNWFMGELVKFAARHGVRVTILSGDVHLCAISRFKSKIHTHTIKTHEGANKEVLTNAEHDPRLIFNVISSAMINAPPPDGMATLLNKRSKVHHFDKTTDEDVVEMFATEVTGGARTNKLFMNKRNYSDLIPVKNLQRLKGGLARYQQFQEGDLIYPGVSDKLQKVDKENIDIRDASHVGYALTDDSIVASLHVEIDRKNTQSNTKDYEVLIPKIDGPQELGVFPDGMKKN